MRRKGEGGGPFQQVVHRLGGGLVAQSTAQALDVLTGLWEEAELLADLCGAVEHGSVVSAAEEAANLCEGAVGLFSEKVHSDLAGIRQLAVAVAAGKELAAEVEVAADGGEDGLGRGQRGW
jgi:hypothetical protein